jgi:hypothetical protein
LIPANHTAAELQVKIDMSIYDEYQIVITEAQRKLIVRAGQMTNETARTIMRRIANDYDRLAKLAEEQLAAQERQSD